MSSYICGIESWRFGTLYYLLSFSSFRIQLEVKVSSREDLHDLEMSETRILLLYSTRQEGSQIMKWAKEAGLTAKSYVWIATQSVIGESFEALPDFPEGMLGKYFFLLPMDPKIWPQLCWNWYIMYNTYISNFWKISSYKCELSLVH